MKSSVSYRMASRAFHCYACERSFKAMINVASGAEPTDVTCQHCASAFVELKSSMSPNQEPQQPMQASQEPSLFAPAVENHGEIL